MAIQPHEGARSRRQSKTERGDKPWRTKRAEARSERRKTAQPTKGISYEVISPEGKVDPGTIYGGQGQPQQVVMAPAGPQVVSPKFDERGRVMVSIEDLRDDTISVIRNSHKTAEQIRADGGPHPQTLAKWLEGETKRPQLNTIRAALLACDYDFAVVARRRR